MRKSPHQARSLLGVTAIPGPSSNETPRPGDPTQPRFNIAPTQDVLGLITAAATRQAMWFRWGLVPPGAGSLSIGAKMINARSETIFKRSAFARSIIERRCLIPGDGFIEWKRIGKTKHPFHIRMEDEGVFMMAGVWQRWTSPTGITTLTCAIITTTANTVVAPVHDRMPVILHEDDHARWLDPELRSNDALSALMAPFPSEPMTAVPINPRINDVAHDDPDCFAEVAPAPPPAEQLGFRFGS